MASCVDEPLHLLFVTLPTGDDPPDYDECSCARSLPETAARCASWRTYVGAPRRRVFHQYGHRALCRRRRGGRSLQGAAGKPRARFTSPACTCTPAGMPTSRRTRFRSAADRPQRCHRPARRRRGECTLNGLYLADGDRLVDNHTVSTTPRRIAPATKSTRAFSGARRARVQRQDRRSPGCAEDRREANQPGAAAVGQRIDQYQAAARNLCRRCEVHARRGDWPARRGRDLLPARARAELFRGARHADPRFCRRYPGSCKVEPLRVALEGELYAQLAKDLAEIDAA